MGLLAYFIALLIGLSIAGLIYLMICYIDFTIYLIIAAIVILGALLIGIPIADLLGIHP